MSFQLELLPEEPQTDAPSRAPLERELEGWVAFGKPTVKMKMETDSTLPGNKLQIPVYINEFWTARQRQAHSLHEISYRACFKPQLPRFFIERLTNPGDVVYDPFMGRGTTLVEAALLGRIPWGCDVNPLCRIMAGARLKPPSYTEVEERLNHIDLDRPGDMPEELLVFFHKETLKSISSLREYFFTRQSEGLMDEVDLWLQMVSLNRLTGHSSGFFSVYTMPPNQAVSVASQIRINERRKQIPPVRNVKPIVLKKSRQLMSDLDDPMRLRLSQVSSSSKLVVGLASQTRDIPSESVSLAVTSPPFLNIVQYATDNWLRCWFAGIDPAGVAITMASRASVWQAEMQKVLIELFRIIKPGGHLAFEVGEVQNGKLKLEDLVVPAGIQAGFQAELVLINDQEFTKTANCWGVSNNARGTNSNRIVLFRRP